MPGKDAMKLGFGVGMDEAPAGWGIGLDRSDLDRFGTDLGVGCFPSFPRLPSWPIRPDEFIILVRTGHRKPAAELDRKLSWHWHFVKSSDKIRLVIFTG
jgi:hypothetical protein